jgi:hypothetical protein
MSTESEPKTRYAFITATAALITAIGAIAPLVTAVAALVGKGTPKGEAVTVVIQNVSGSWLCGAKQISGMSPCLLQPPFQAPRQPTNASEPKGASASTQASYPSTTRTLGQLEQQIPINEIPGWRLPQAQFPRTVRFDLIIEAKAEEVESRASLVTLQQDGTFLCSYRFDIGGNTRGRVAQAKRCNEDVSADEAHIYTVKIDPPSKAVSVTMNVFAERPH